MLPGDKQLKAVDKTPESSWWQHLFVFRGNNLSKRILFYILLCSTCFAFIVTLLQLAWDYRQGVHLIENRINQIEVSYLSPLSASLWDINSEQVEVLVEGIMKLPDMQYVQVMERFENRKMEVFSKGISATDYDFQREFDLVYKDEIIGSLFVAASLDEVYQQLWQKAMVILVSQFIKTLLVSVIILFIIYQLVMRHLKTIVEYTRSIKLDSLDKALELNRPAGKTADELAELVNTINHMRVKIRQEFNAKELITTQLSRERDFSSTVINVSNAVIASVDQNFNILTINPAGEKLFSRTEQLLQGLSWKSVCCDDHSRLNMEQSINIQSLIEGKELTFVDNNGFLITMLWSFFPFNDEASACRMLTFGYDITALKQVESEIKVLNSQLEEKVNLRTKSLEESNSQLIEAFRELKDTQKTLVEAEKMAALGSLVAGVAHEINTPLGVGVTAASFIKGCVEDLADKIESANLTKNYLQKTVAQLTDSAEILLSNQKRASNIISSFKQVAVDQSTSSCYDFNVKENLDQVLLSLKHDIELAGCDIQVRCDDELIINSYPGSFTQIYTNLISNSIRHGFDGWDGLRNIAISIEKRGDSLLVDYWDSGQGIGEDIAVRIFDPFITSKRGQGNSGLGTHIIYNLVVQLLKGNIDLDSSPGEGVHFRLVLPCESNVPARLESN